MKLHNSMDTGMDKEMDEDMDRDKDSGMDMDMDVGMDMDMSMMDGFHFSLKLMLWFKRFTSDTYWGLALNIVILLALCFVHEFVARLRVALGTPLTA